MVKLKRTPLYSVHVQEGARLMEFAGWELPVWYTSIVSEHMATRNKVGLFDVSHMGELEVSGPEAEVALNFLTCNDVTKIAEGQAQYNAILNEHGGVVDDIIVYRYSSERYLLCVNARNTDQDFDWFTTHNSFQAKIVNLSESYAQLALQGPAASDLVRVLPGGTSIINLKNFYFSESILAGVPVVAARTGYTGEDGFEFFVASEFALRLWQVLTEIGQGYGLVPVGLGARDTLRLEAAYPLHGHELAPSISALASGLGWIVKFDKGEFLGRASLLAEKQAGRRQCLVALRVLDNGVVRAQVELFSKAGVKVGNTTSGTKTPSLEYPIALGLVEASSAQPGTQIMARVRGRELACEIVKKPFYSKK